MIDWSGCPLVIRREGFIGGKPALRDDTRVPPETIVVNMDDDMTAEEVADIFGLRTSLSEIQAIYDFAKKQGAQSAV